MLRGGAGLIDHSPASFYVTCHRSKVGSIAAAPACAASWMDQCMETSVDAVDRYNDTSHACEAHCTRFYSTKKHEGADSYSARWLVRTHSSTSLTLAETVSTQQCFDPETEATSISIHTHTPNASTGLDRVESNQDLRTSIMHRRAPASLLLPLQWLRLLKAPSARLPLVVAAAVGNATTMNASASRPQQQQQRRLGSSSNSAKDGSVTLGFVGLGQMGARMAANLLQRASRALVLPWIDLYVC